MSIGKLVKKMQMHRQSRITRAMTCCKLVAEVLAPFVEATPADAKAGCYDRARQWEKIYRSRVEFIAELERETDQIQWNGGKHKDRRTGQIFTALNGVYQRYFSEQMTLPEFYATVAAFIDMPRPTTMHETTWAANTP